MGRQLLRVMGCMPLVLNQRSFAYVDQPSAQGQCGPAIGLADLMASFLSDFEPGEIGPDLFRKVCEFEFEGLISKHRDRPYRSRSG